MDYTQEFTIKRSSKPMNYETENVFNNSNPSCTEDTKDLLYKSLEKVKLYTLTLWRWNFLLNFSTPCT